MFYSAMAFNQNIAGWNVLRVTTLTGAFESTAHADCYKRGSYGTWGATLQFAYPTWASLALCTARCDRSAAHARARTCPCTVDRLRCVPDCRPWCVSSWAVHDLPQRVRSVRAQPDVASTAKLKLA